MVLFAQGAVLFKIPAGARVAFLFAGLVLVAGSVDIDELGEGLGTGCVLCSALPAAAFELLFDDLVAGSVP